MPRAVGNDIAEIFGYAPDDQSEAARKQWKSQHCPFVGNICIKQTDRDGGQSPRIWGTCSLLSRSRNRFEEVIACPQRFYADGFASLRQVVFDATGRDLPIYTVGDHIQKVPAATGISDYAVRIGRGSGTELKLRNEQVNLSLDWVLAVVSSGRLSKIIPCEVQSMDTTGNYHTNWEAYSLELPEVPNARFGFNWANVWKRLIPQLILKGSVARSSSLCSSGSYFMVPEAVFLRFEKLLGDLRQVHSPARGVLTVLTYGLGPEVPHGHIRQLEYRRMVRTGVDDLALAFATAGDSNELGELLELQVRKRLLL